MNNNVVCLLERAATRFPNKIALKDENNSRTYQEYLQDAKRIAAFIIDNVTQGAMQKPVAVIIDRNIESIIAFMGCAYAGCFYVPIDATMPKERLDKMLSSLNPACILDAIGDCAIEDSIAVSDIIYSDSDFDEDMVSRVRDRVIDTDPLYALFTSGSTGVPKGVLVSHGSVIDLVEAFDDAFKFDEETVFGNQAPFDFDVSVKDIYNALYSCGSVVVIPRRFFTAPKRLLEYLAEEKINTLIWAVSALRIVADFKALEDIGGALSGLKRIMFSGEVMPVKALNYWMNALPNTEFVNLYGPTEITCNCTYYIIDRVYDLDERLPIGVPFRNSRVLLLDDEKKVIEDSNILGEICVAGIGVSLGYWNNPEKTAEQFIQNPVQAAYPNKIYATGDLGYYDEQGLLYFASRRDHQIKHMGHRIELGEIEVAINSLEFIDVACCIYSEAEEKIYCFYQANKECKKEIVQGLVSIIPKYMWPNKFVHFTEIPLNSHSKIDRTMLKAEYIDK